MYVTLYKNFQKSGLLFKLTKTSRSSNSSRVSFLRIFFTRGLLSNVYKNAQKLFCFVLFVVIKKNCRKWFFETCRHSLTCMKCILKGFQKQSHRGVPMKRCSENMQQIYRRTPMPKCDFNKVALKSHFGMGVLL